MSKHISYCQVITHSGETWIVNSKGSGLYTHFLKKMLDQVSAMFSYHNKLFLLRFDLHQPEATPTSKHLTEFLKSLIIKKHIDITSSQGRYTLGQEKLKVQIISTTTASSHWMVIKYKPLTQLPSCSPTTGGFTMTGIYIGHQNAAITK